MYVRVGIAISCSLGQVIVSSALFFSLEQSKQLITRYVVSVRRTADTARNLAEIIFRITITCQELEPGGTR